MIAVTLAWKTIAVLRLYVKKGADEFARVAGEVAAEKAKSLLKTLKARWTGDQEATKILACFEENPEHYQSVLEDILEEKLAWDKDLETELTGIMEDMGPKLEVIIKMMEAEDVVGMEVDKIKWGKFKVSQEIKEYKGVAVGMALKTERLFLKPPSVLPVEPPPRYADFSFHYDNKNKQGQKVPDGHTLQAEQWYQLEVAIRVKPTGIPFEGAERVPIREPKQKQDVTIMVTAEAEDEEFIEIEEPVQTLTLPPLGESTENALFRVCPLRQSASSNDLAQIRVRLYYEFNLLEVAVIRAEVVGKFDGPAESQQGLEKPIAFRQERLEREYIDFDNIQPRAMHIDITKRGDHFLFNFAFYNAVDQKVIFTAPARLSAADLEDDLISIRKIWYDIAMSKTFTEQLEGDKDEFLINVRRLAEAGRRLWIKLFKRERKSSMYKIGMWLERHPLKRDEIVQVSLHKNAANFVFPWPLIYDQKVPRSKCELPDPEGFWGLRYRIEQQLPNMIKGTDEPIHIADKLKLGFMLWDQFRNTDKEKSLMKNLMARSAGKLEVSTPPITDAGDCYDLLSDCDAHILYFYTHGYTRHRQADIGVGPNLELFLRRYERLDENSPLRETYRVLYESIKQNQFEPDRSWIELTYGKLYLEELYDDISDLQSCPFVILNMCESAQVTPSLSDSFIHFFLDRGARGVIGTECPMTIEFAHPFAEKFLRDMLAGEQVGIALLNARRHFIELKNPLGLAYTLLSSATVCFEPPRL